MSSNTMQCFQSSNSCSYSSLRSRFEQCGSHKSLVLLSKLQGLSDSGGGQVARLSKGAGGSVSDSLKDSVNSSANGPDLSNIVTLETIKESGVKKVLDVVSNASSSKDQNARAQAHKQALTMIYSIMLLHMSGDSLDVVQNLLGQIQEYYDDYKYLGAKVLPDLVELPKGPSIGDFVENYDMADRRLLEALDLAQTSVIKQPIQTAQEKPEISHSCKALNLQTSLSVDHAGVVEPPLKPAKKSAFIASYAKPGKWGNDFTLSGAMYELNRRRRAEGKSPIAVEVNKELRESGKEKSGKKYERMHAIHPPGWSERGGLTLKLLYWQDSHYDRINTKGEKCSVQGDGNCQFRALSESLREHGIYYDHKQMREFAVKGMEAMLDPDSIPDYGWEDI